MATHCYVIYCDVAHLLCVTNALVVTANPPVHCQNASKKHSLSAILYHCDRKKIVKLLTGLTRSTNTVSVDGSRKLLLKLLFQSMKVNDEHHRRLSQHELTTCVNNHVLLKYFLTKLSAGNAYRHQMLMENRILS